jgi:hypothetical protein
MFPTIARPPTPPMGKTQSPPGSLKRSHKVAEARYKSPFYQQNAVSKNRGLGLCHQRKERLPVKLEEVLSQAVPLPEPARAQTPGTDQAEDLFYVDLTRVTDSNMATPELEESPCFQVVSYRFKPSNSLPAGWVIAFSGSDGDGSGSVPHQHAGPCFLRKK